MARLTYKNPDGTFGLNNGYDMHKVPTELYGAIWKLKDYEETGLDPEEAREYTELGLTLEQLKEIDKLYLEKCQEINRLTAEKEELRECNAEYNNGWIPAENRTPDSDNYVLLSFANFSIPMVGRYEEDDNGGAFYVGDDTETCISEDLFVNAWQPLPEPYQKGE